MSISELMQAMADAGAPMEAIILAVRALEAKDAQIAARDAKQAEKRAKDAERKRIERDSRTIRGQSVDSPETLTGQESDPSLSPFPNENNSNPNPHTHPDIKPARKGKSQAPDKPDGVDDRVWADFVKLRQKKGGISETAINGIQREAAKAGWTLDDALAEVVSRNWQGFKAEWVLPKVSAAASSAHTAFLTSQPPQRLPEHEWRALMGDEEFERQKSSLQIEEASVQ